MILQALTDYYRELTAQGLLAAPGWSKSKISYALSIDEQGAILQAICIKTEQLRGKKTVLLPQELLLPAPVKRTVGIAPNFLWDNAGYILGVDDKGNPTRSRACFEACRALHTAMLSDVESPAARAVLAFFQSWNPETAASHPALQECWEDLLGGSNLTFLYNGRYVAQDAAIAAAWERSYNSSDDQAPQGVCLVTGERTAIESVHPPIKNVAGAQSSGAALVSFNAPAFCSYGKEQNLNAPTGKYAAFAYTAALNYLLSDRERVSRIGDTTVVFWSKNADTTYQDFLNCEMFGDESHYSEQDLRTAMQAICEGRTAVLDEHLLDPNMDFYILGLAPNAARLSVRFFLRNTFGFFLKNIRAHQERLEIVRPAYDRFETIPLWKLLDETVNQNARNKSPSPILAGEMLRAILYNTPYPATLRNAAMLRIRAEQKVTRGRAAILKSYYLSQRTENPAVPKEVLTVSLNRESKSIPYNLGRLFAVLERIQQEANPGINTTIRDRYFNAASATPAHVFPTLINLAQKHLKKLPDGQTVYFNKLLGEILNKLPEGYPTHLSLPEQGSFQLGYYHQTQ